MKLRKLLLGGVVLAASTSIPSQAQIRDRVAFSIPPIAIVWSGNVAGNAAVSDVIVGRGGGAANNGDAISAAGRAVVTGTLTQVATTGASGSVGVTGAVDATSPTGFADFDTITSEFEIDGNTSLSLGPAIRSSFFVASNAAFNIQMDIDENVSPNPAFVDIATTPTEPEFINTNTIALAEVNYDMAVVSGSAAGDFEGAAIAGAPGNTGDNSRDPLGGAVAGTIATATNLSAVDGTDVFVGGQSTAASPGSITSQSVRFDNTYTLPAIDLSDGEGEFVADVTFTVYIP